MKPNTFKYSVLTVGIVAAMGIAGTASAADTSISYDDSKFFVKNKATATYKVAGNDTDQTAESNEVVVTVSELGQFSLIAIDGSSAIDDLNDDITFNPSLVATVDFNHTLKNEGNVNDTYTIAIDNQATGDDFEYDIANTKITYQKVDASGNDTGAADVSVANGGKIELAPGESAKIKVTAISKESRVIGDDGILIVTAKSKYLEDRGQTSTVTNTDNAITTTPIYAISKSLTTNLSNNKLDLQNDSAFVEYTIKVKNDGNANGTNVTIEDVLPEGLVLITDTNSPAYAAPTSTITGSGTAIKPVISNSDKTITLTGQNIAMGQEVTITFRAKKADNATVSSDFSNYAIVRDDTNDDGTFDLVDSSGGALDNETTENNYEDTTTNLGKDIDKGTVTPSNQTRKITISDGENKEVALKSNNNLYTYTINNEGTDITEGDAQDEVYFSVLPTTDNTAVTIETVFVDANNDGIAQESEKLIEVTPNSGKYDLNDAVSAGLAPGASVKISVIVSTNGSGSNFGQDSDIGKSEVMTIKVLPQTVVDGTPVPAGDEDSFTTSTTTMQGLGLFKYQLVDNCSVTIDSIANSDSRWIQGNATGTAKQCVFYKIEASNTFTNVGITDVVVSDTIAPQSTYRTDFNATPSTATNNSSATEVSGTFATIAPKAKAIIKFSTKISQTGNSPTSSSLTGSNSQTGASPIQ